MFPLAQLIIIELGCLDICNRNMRKFEVKYNQWNAAAKVHPVMGIKCTFWAAGFLTVQLLIHPKLQWHLCGPELLHSYTIAAAKTTPFYLRGPS